LNQDNNQNCKKLHKSKGQVAIVKNFQLDSLCKHLFLKLNIQHMLHHKLGIDVKLNQYKTQDCKKLHKSKGQVELIKSFQLNSLCKYLLRKYCNFYKCHHKLNIYVKLNQDNNQDCKKLHKSKGQVAVVKSFQLDSLYN